MLDYPALAAVAAVIREGTFERAALSLGITPSAVSQRVRGFEERLGAILIIRGQPCHPTELGRKLCAHFDRVRLLETDLAIRKGPDPSRAPLKIAVNADSLATWFLEAARTFGHTAGIPLELTLDDEAHTADRLRSGEVVAAVTADAGPVQGCRTIPLGSLRYAACASPGFVARFFPNNMTAAELAEAPCLRFDPRDGLQARWAREVLDIELDAPSYSVASTHAFIDLAIAGLAWGMQPVQLAEPHIAAGRLVELAPQTRIDVELNWIVAGLPVASLDLLTKAVRSSAQNALF
ncbi:LysR family transcriptional regulator ArgP [Pelagibacterium sp. H642]|uniref:LysR family transcriptional regulator ArgP n=1 Tax=Pelagibacterium sp. H642 TaxID=1881069 RepID=UPI002816498E|nr:LysR family transcriptional regulator ArgP [Pelagibacterium sp. H642]WMT91874.1 LysR family transcriptional regulator ArgP [Pelagibacterium sp. H642]